MRKLLALTAVAMFAAVAAGCNCCDLSCFRRTTAAMPVYAQCAPAYSQCATVASPAATVVEPTCAQPSFTSPSYASPTYSSPTIVPGPIVTQ